MFDPTCRYRLDPRVAIRPERFGALAYHYGNRRLTFLKSKRLVELVTTLASYATAADALDALGVPDHQRDMYEAALARLVSSEMILIHVLAPPELVGAS